MSGELKVPAATGSNVYAIISLRNQFYNGTSLGTYSSASYSNYARTVTEVGTSGVFLGDFPTGLTTAGLYDVFYYLRAGASPVEGDTQIASATINWNGSRAIATEDPTSNRTSLIRVSYSSGQTVKAVILKGSQWWNGTTFGSYSGLASHIVDMTESGSTGIYSADLPSGIQDDGLYECFFFLWGTETPLIGASSFNFSPTAASTITTGGLSGSDLYSRFLQIFIDTSKETLFYQVLTRTVQQIKRRSYRDESRELVTPADAITTLGEWRIDLDSDFGLFVGNVIIQDGDHSYPLDKVSPAEYDNRIANPSYGSVYKGKPRFFTIRQGQIWLGPVPDSISYTYKIDQMTRLTSPITSETSLVPFSVDYEEELIAGCLYRVFAAVEEFDRANYWQSVYESLGGEADLREERNQTDDVCMRRNW